MDNTSDMGTARHVVGFSGRIAAGKTTAAHWCESHGFCRTRISLVIDDEIRSLGLPLDRNTRQEIGMQLHDERGQAWLCERAVARVSAARLVVIDGLRWPEDHHFFSERWGANFTHFHVVAPAEVRFQRLSSDDFTRVDFDRIDGHPVEKMIDTLQSLATYRIENITSLAQFRANIDARIRAVTAEIA